jgi:hypothetical protein
MIIIHDVEQGTPEWLQLREGLWTGSKAIRLLQGKSMPKDYAFEGNDATRRGHALEHAMKSEYERRYRRKIKRPGFVTNTVYPNGGYSPDGLEGGWLIEMKAFQNERLRSLIKNKSTTNLQEIVASKIPLEVKVQIFFGMIITGKRKARLLAIDPDAIDKEQLTVIEITYDKLIGNNIRKKLRLDMKKRLTSTSVNGSM